MAKNLVIVESPAKARTVGRFLGGKYTAKASMGHVRDLPRRKIGVEVADRSFKPTYQIPSDKRKIVSELKAAAKEAETIYLATDPDREGEAISWHLINAANMANSNVKRVVFHEITQDAIREAFENPREIDQNLVDAQQARRVLDRLVGYELSPVLWKKVRRGLSAGRVQSITVRLIVDRERENLAFNPEEFWKIEAVLGKQPQNDTALQQFTATLRRPKGHKGSFKVANATEANRISTDIDDADFLVDSVSKRQTHNRPTAPFTTSTLQQEAWRKLRFTARRTMSVAQQLYEGLHIGNEGSVGLITYMRTDSTTVANSAVQETRGYISLTFGPDYLPKSPRVYTKKTRGAQEAHEAIRPTSITREPESIKSYLNNDQARLYGIIWRRMLASQMADALIDRTTIDIAAVSQSNAKYDFRAQGQVLKFPGFRAVYMEDRDDAENDDSASTNLPELTKGEALNCHKITKEQRFTEPPPRYSEATLVKELEENGIGRPSTYAPTIATVQERDYVRKEKGRFSPTKLGFAVNDLLMTHFPNILDVDFTAKIEEELDEIASGERQWVPMLKEFYDPFNESVVTAIRDAERVPRNQIDEESEEVCEKCERPMVIKSGRFGRFLSCSGFPECKNSKPLLNKMGVDCPECGNELVERMGGKRGGRPFYACSGYPSCKFLINRKPLSQPCPDCSGLLIQSAQNTAQCSTCTYKGPVLQSES